MGVGLEEPRSDEGVAHGDAGAEVEHHGIVEILTGRRDLNGGRGCEAPLETLHPVAARRHDGGPHELVSVERQHHMQLGSSVEQGFGGEDVGTGGE